MKIAKQRRNKGIFKIPCIIFGKEPKLFPGHRGINVLIQLIGFSGCGEIRPGRNADNSSGSGHFQLLQLQAKAEAQSTAGTLTAQHDLPV